MKYFFNHFKETFILFLKRIEQFDIITNWSVYILLSIGLFYYTSSAKQVILDLLQPNYYLLILFYFIITLYIIATLDNKNKKITSHRLLLFIEKLSSTLFDIWGVILVSLIYLSLFKNLFYETLCYILGSAGIMISISFFISALNVNISKK